MLHSLKHLALLGAVLSLDIALAPGLLAGPRVIDAHRARWEYEEQEWSEPKVELNVQYRVPVVDTIGYLAVNYNEPQRLNQLLTKVRPISQRVADLSEGTFQGRKFPAEVEVELDKLRQQMMADVTAIYGADVTKKLEAFLAQKYGALDQGLFGGPLR
ncbi:MAG: hypothetical protein Q7Q73_09590 [Verrucomicrobiota bacterium JB024]|nr:hypothetical protein [Verrucomicrobiota bacterium JB024]